MGWKAPRRFQNGDRLRWMVENRVGTVIGADACGFYFLPDDGGPRMYFWDEEDAGFKLVGRVQRSNNTEAAQ